MSEQDAQKIIARNKRARYRYHVEETYQAGLVLRGTEVKSLRAGNVSLADSFARFEGGELYLRNCHIAPWESGSYFNHEPMRVRKLLMTKRELKKLRTKVEERGFTLVPLSLYFTRGLAKVKLGLCRGKQLRDRRQDVKKRDEEREIRRNYG